MGGVGVLAVEFVVLWFLVGEFKVPGFLRDVWKRSYEGSGFSEPLGMGVRLAVIFGTIVVGAAVLSLISERSGVISRLGTRSLYMYVLHYGIVMFALAVGWFDLVPEGDLWTILVILLCFALGAILCSRPTQLIFHRLLEPPTDWLFKSRPNRPPVKKTTPPTSDDPRVAASRT
ncbi:hypothetical protein [Actinocorallia sp. A-T 12471]|uniref:hypothetical protein n=1 Tax=Actinocorallia sp. A-T 12471 TaxID=3089813 RepID=UPI0029CEFDD1|nr:hypothetical protein [Actinocorallia sp. A-T 12471]MDX6744000.1 hypothetical protein [Actinocorallia sp. A-T 12471]